MRSRSPSRGERGEEAEALTARPRVGTLARGLLSSATDKRLCQGAVSVASLSSPVMGVGKQTPRPRPARVRCVGAEGRGTAQAGCPSAGPTAPELPPQGLVLLLGATGNVSPALHVEVPQLLGGRSLCLFHPLGTQPLPPPGPSSGRLLSAGLLEGTQALQPLRVRGPEQFSPPGDLPAPVESLVVHTGLGAEPSRGPAFPSSSVMGWRCPQPWDAAGQDRHCHGHVLLPQPHVLDGLGGKPQN